MFHSLRLIVRSSAIAASISTFVPLAGAQSKATIEQFLSPSSPLEITSSHRADRVAWIAYDRGMRNVYAAAAPDFQAVRLTKFLADDGTDMTNVELSDDGRIAVFVRGSAPNRVGWVANPSHDPDGAERAIWAARTDGTGAWRLAEGGNPVLSPDGKSVLYVKDGQIYRARTSQPAPAPSEKPTKSFIREWGNNSNPRWSPDGATIAFVSNRQNHSFIGLYDVKTRRVSYVSPSVDFDGSPTWSPDSKRLAFTRRPGTPFALQSQEGSGGIGNPTGPAFSAAATAAAPERGGAPDGGFRGVPGDATSRGGRAGGARDTTPIPARQRGLTSSAFAGGYTLAFMVTDIATGETREFWHNAPNETIFTNINAIRWAGETVLFPVNVPDDDFDRYFSVTVDGAGNVPVMLTTTNGLIEDNTSIALSVDGKTLYYCTNATDIERRHIWAVPTSGGMPRQVSTGDGIETHPVPLGSGKNLGVLYFDARTPASIGIVATAGGKAKVVYPTLGKGFPTAAHVQPEIVITKSPDGMDIHNQLFMPKDMKPGEKRPALIFVHGGPQRQMMPGYHYMQFYHWAYAYNQWLADQGYVVLSINYRSGTGYGKAFRNAPGTQARGNSEYQDVVTGAKYLQGRADVDPARVGIWGLSYGGLLTSQALARNSDIFVAGVDLAGVHLYGNSVDSTNLAYQSSAISSIDKWTSPVFLVHGDDDRNVDFSQTIGLVQLLRARNIYYELTVVPDNVHESLIHKDWIDTFGKMGVFLKTFVWDKPSTGR
jgi:dipeptidyl-peptidase-4